jgi:hypothetical protein
MSTLRDRVVGLLSVTIDELRANERNHEGHDDVAVKIVAKARVIVSTLRDRYADGAPKALHRTAAQETRDLSELLEKIGKDSGNANAARDLEYAARRLNFFIVTNADVNGDVKFRFRT